MATHPNHPTFSLPGIIQYLYTIVAQAGSTDRTARHLHNHPLPLWPLHLLLQNAEQPRFPLILACTERYSRVPFLQSKWCPLVYCSISIGPSCSVVLPSAHPVSVRRRVGHFHHRFFRRSRLLQVPFFPQVTNPACPTSTYLSSFFPNLVTSTFTPPFEHTTINLPSSSPRHRGKEDLTASCGRTAFQCHIFFTIDRELRFSQIIPYLQLHDTSRQRPSRQQHRHLRLR